MAIEQTSILTHPHTRYYRRHSISPMPTSSYRPYNTSYNSTSYNTYRSTPTSRQPYTSSTYQTTSRYRSPISTPDPYTPSSYSPIRYEPSKYGSTSRTSNRPLPAGPGPLDARGRKGSVAEHIKLFSKAGSTPPRYSGKTRTSPVKADYTTSNYTYGASSNATSSEGYLSKFNRGKRTNSISDLTSGLNKVQVSSTTTPLNKASKRYGSNLDLSSSSRLSTPEKKHDKDYLQDSSFNSTGSLRSTPRKSIPAYDANDTTGFPDIKPSRGRTVRSPSSDRSRDLQAYSRDDESPRSHRRKDEDALRQDSNSSLSSICNGRNSVETSYSSSKKDWQDLNDYQTGLDSTMKLPTWRELRPFTYSATLVLLFYFLFMRKTSFRRSARWEPLASVRFIPQNTQAINAGPGNPPFSKIPKIIHQTWKSEDIPELMKPWVSSWLERNPDWEYWLWTDKDIRDFIGVKYPQFLSLYDSYPMHGYRVDAFRYFVLYEYGGLYVDMDVECLRPVDAIMDSHDCIISQEPLEHAHFLSPMGIPLVSNAIMACRPGHPFFELLVNHLPGYAGSFQWNNIFHATGPYMLTEIYRGYQRKGLLWSNEDVPYLGTPEQFQPIVDLSMVDHMREMCTYSRGKTFMSKQYLAHQVELCNKVSGNTFDDSPPKESYTTHHWTHTWAGRKHDPWGVFNNDRTFTITDIHHLHRKKDS